MALPTRIPPQTAPLTMAGQDGVDIVDTNWYLFLYNLWLNVLGASGGEIPMPATVAIALTDIDVDAADIPHVYRQVVNTELLQTDAEAGMPTLLGLTNALLLATDAVLPDPPATAQPSAVFVVGGSPFTYTAPFNGSVVIKGGTVSALAIVRQGTSIATGLTAGIFPLSRNDQLVITHTGAPTATFLPT